MTITVFMSNFFIAYSNIIWHQKYFSFNFYNNNLNYLVNMNIR